MEKVMSKTISVLIFSTAILAGFVVFFIITSKETSINDPLFTPSPSAVPSNGPSNLIRLEKPGPDQLVSSPLVVAGEARGYWFFEANFPVRIYDANGVELGVAVAQADGEWMTEEFVRFHAVLRFKKPATTSGTLVLQKDNPSGLPEHEAELRVPISFDLANWPEDPAISGGCKVGGCSGQLCVDESAEDFFTTCEWLEEYACYKNSRCERQSDGKCDWTPTEELISCLKAAEAR